MKIEISNFKLENKQKIIDFLMNWSEEVAEGVRNYKFGKIKSKIAETMGIDLKEQKKLIKLGTFITWISEENKIIVYYAFPNEQLAFTIPKVYNSVTKQLFDLLYEKFKEIEPEIIIKFSKK